MLVNLVGYWLLGLPFGCLLCFGYGVGVAGLWLGLCAGLMIVAPTLLVVWARRSRDLDAIREAAAAIAV